MAREGRATIVEQVEKLTESFKGQIVVTVKDEVWDRVEEEFKKASIIKLSNGKGFNMKALSNLLKRVYNAQEGANFQKIIGNMAIVKLKEEKQLKRVMENSPWYFKGVAILMKRWEKGKKLEDLEFEGLKVWMQIHSLSFGFTSKNIAAGFEYAGKVCGDPLKGDDVF